MWQLVENNDDLNSSAYVGKRLKNVGIFFFTKISETCNLLNVLYYSEI